MVIRYELIDDDTKLISRMCNDGWELVNTFPNPHPCPYFFSLMRRDNGQIEDTYDIQAIKDELEKKHYPDGKIPF